MQAPHVSPELIELFEVYTANPQSIGESLANAACRRHASDPLLVATAGDFILFPGGGRPPEIESFRLATRAFKELAGVSHLPPAVATVVQLKLQAPDGELWRREANRLMAATAKARAANSVALWRDTIAVAAYRGREAAIAALVDHACARTIRYLERILAGEIAADGETLAKEYTEVPGNPAISCNAIMIATFFLVGMDIGHRVITWLQRHAIDWSRAMVLITGRLGRPTAGVTISSNSVCATILGASGYQLPLDRMYIAPHAPAASLPPGSDAAAAGALEMPMRKLWAKTRAISEVAALMFPGYPAYSVAAQLPPEITPATTLLADMPRIKGPDDWLAMTTRLRLVMEDPRQLLSGCVTDYAVEQLHRAGNDPSRVIVPGLDGVTYPQLP